MTVPAVTSVRAELVRVGLDGFIVPRADEHLGEYVPPGAERLQWLTGFSGSAGLAVVLAKGRRIAVSAGFDAATLERMVQVLERM